jgi:hypothetical protein
MMPLTLTSPRVWKNFTDSGQMTYVHPPGFGLFRNVAVNRRLMDLVVAIPHLSLCHGLDHLLRPKLIFS